MSNDFPQRKGPSGPPNPGGGGGIVPPAGQIDGTVSDPLIIGITDENSTELGIGTINDGEFLRRVGNQIVSAAVTLAISVAAPITGDGSVGSPIGITDVSNTERGTVPAITAGSAALVSNGPGTASAWNAIAGGGAPVGTGRAVNTTAPLAGGGDLSADLTLTVATVSNLTSGVVPAITDATAVPLSNGGGTAAVWTALSGGGSPVGTSRAINTTAPLAGGGDLSADRTLTVAAVSNTSSGVAPIHAGAADVGKALLATSTGSTWSTDFGAQNLTTTGDLIIGATPSTAGDIRVNHGFSLQGRNATNTTDRNVISWGVTSGAVIVGDTSATLPNLLLDTGSNRTDIRIATTSHVRISANVCDFNPGAADFDVRSGGQALFGLDQAGSVRNLAIFAAASTNFQSGDRTIYIADRIAAPTGNPTAGGYLYSAAGAGTWRGSGGTITTFGPAEPHCQNCGRDSALQWENPEQGWHLAICVWCLTDEIENKAGIERSKFTMRKTALTQAALRARKETS